MDNMSELAVAAAVLAAARAATAAARVYDAVCKEPGVLAARRRRGLMGLGKHLTGDPNASDLDRNAIDLVLLFIGRGETTPLDDRINTVYHLGQEALARPTPPARKPIASTDDIALCLALDTAALIRVAVELALGATNLDIASEWAGEGDADADRAIATRLTLDIHTPVGLAFGATCITTRIFVARHRLALRKASRMGPDVHAYDTILEAAASNILRIHVCARSDNANAGLDPTLGPAASHLASELANIAHNAAVGAGEDDSVLAPSVIAIGHIASDAVNLAAEAAEAYEVACKAMLS